ncbi:MAG: hypothetical protein IRY91_15880, partial [Gemmatimonadaceae bacterium]|nr:hypothetical protein [Gemmatimonadaceae bacterium]
MRFPSLVLLAATGGAFVAAPPLCAQSAAADPATASTASPASDSLRARSAASASDAPVVRLLTPERAAQLRARKWIYVTRLMGNGPPSRLGFRTLELSEASWHGTPAWLLVDSRQLATVTLAESLYVARNDLSPLYRVLHAPGSDVSATYGADSIRTAFDDSTGHTVVAMASAPAVLGNMYLLELLIGGAPLHVGWAGRADWAVASREQSSIVPVTMRVTGDETVLAPDGSFDCWLVEMAVGRSTERLWVRKSDGVVVRERLPVVGMAGAEIELL